MLADGNANAGCTAEALAVYSRGAGRVEQDRRCGPRKPNSGASEDTCSCRSARLRARGREQLSRGDEITRHQQAKWWELGATTSRARFLPDAGRAGKERTMLSEIYNWFTEGSDTADAKDAKDGAG
jgi:hypothetical protein